MKFVKPKTKARKKTLEKTTEKSVKRGPGRPPKNSAVIKSSENPISASTLNKGTEKPSETKVKQDEGLVIRIPLSSIENIASKADITNLPNSFGDYNEFELIELGDLSVDELLKNI